MYFNFKLTIYINNTNETLRSMQMLLAKSKKDKESNEYNEDGMSSL